MPFAEAADYRFNPFDLTKVWPHGDYPPIEVGRMVLDRNPENFFAEVEQAGFSPANLVPGIGLSPDKMLMGRIFSYHDTHLHRIGANYEQLPINAPKVEVHSYNKDGHMTYRHAGAQPVYAPNSYGGPMADPAGAADIGWSVEGAEIGRYANAQARRGRRLRPAAHDVPRGHERHRTATTSSTTSSATPSDEVTAPMQERVVAYWASVDPELGDARRERARRRPRARAGSRARGRWSPSTRTAPSVAGLDLVPRAVAGESGLGRRRRRHRRRIGGLSRRPGGRRRDVGRRRAARRRRDGGLVRLGRSVWRA